MKKFFVFAATFAACFNLTACAEYPSRISATYIPSIVFKGATCYELNQERIKLASYVQNIAQQQKRTANIDTAVVGTGLFLSWPAIAGLPFTRDQQAQLSVAKGHYDALMTAGRNQNCGPEFLAHHSDDLTWKKRAGDFPPV